MIQCPAGHQLIESVGLMQANVREATVQTASWDEINRQAWRELNIAHGRNGSEGSENIENIQNKVEQMQFVDDNLQNEESQSFVIQSTDFNKACTPQKIYFINKSLT